MFSIFYLWEHTKFGIKIFEIDMLMIFDLLTSPQGHQFDPRMKMLLALCSACHRRRFDMPHDHVWKKNWHPQCLKVPPLGHDPGDRIKIMSDMFCISFICEKTHKVWYKNLWNWHGNRNLIIFDLWPHPKVTSLTLGWKFYLHFVLLVIPINLICHMTMFEKNVFWPPGHPKVPPLGHDPGNRMKIPSDVFCIFHLWEYTQSLV